MAPPIITIMDRPKPTTRAVKTNAAHANDKAHLIAAHANDKARLIMSRDRLRGAAFPLRFLLSLGQYSPLVRAGVSIEFAKIRLSPPSRESRRGDGNRSLPAPTTAASSSSGNTWKAAATGWSRRIICRRRVWAGHATDGLACQAVARRAKAGPTGAVVGSYTEIAATPIPGGDQHE